MSSFLQTIDVTISLADHVEGGLSTFVTNAEYRLFYFVQLLVASSFRFEVGENLDGFIWVEVRCITAFEVIE